MVVLIAALGAGLIAMLCTQWHAQQVQKTADQERAHAISAALRELMLVSVERRVHNRSSLYVDERTLPTVLAYVRRGRHAINVLTGHARGERWGEVLRTEMEWEFFDRRGEELAGVLIDPFGLWVRTLFNATKGGDIGLSAIEALEICEHGTPRFRIRGKSQTIFLGCECTDPAETLEARPVRRGKRK